MFLFYICLACAIWTDFAPYLAICNQLCTIYLYIYIVITNNHQLLSFNQFRKIFNQFCLPFYQFTRSYLQSIDQLESFPLCVILLNHHLSSLISKIHNTAQICVFFGGNQASVKFGLHWYCQFPPDLPPRFFTFLAR